MRTRRYNTGCCCCCCCLPWCSPARRRRRPSRRDNVSASKIDSNLFPSGKKSAKVFDDVFVRVGALIPSLERMHSARGTTRKDPFFIPPKAKEFIIFFFFFVFVSVVVVVKVVVKVGRRLSFVIIRTGTKNPSLFLWGHFWLFSKKKKKERSALKEYYYFVLHPKHFSLSDESLFRLCECTVEYLLLLSLDQKDHHFVVHHKKRRLCDYYYYWIPLVRNRFCQQTFASLRHPPKKSGARSSSTPDDDDDFDFDFDFDFDVVVVVSERRARHRRQRASSTTAAARRRRQQQEASSTSQQLSPGSMFSGMVNLQNNTINWEALEKASENRHAEETGGVFGLIRGELEIKSKRELKERVLGTKSSSC